MAADDRRACPIFRIERGTFQESHTRICSFDYPSSNDEESVFLRVTKLSSPESSSLSLSDHHQSDKKSNSSITYAYDPWNNTDQLSNDTKTKANRTRKHSLSDDYVFL